LLKTPIDSRKGDCWIWRKSTTTGWAIPRVLRAFSGYLVVSPNPDGKAGRSDDYTAPGDLGLISTIARIRPARRRGGGADALSGLRPKNASNATACRRIDLLFVDDCPGKFLCRVNSAVSDDLDTRSSLRFPLKGGGERLLSIGNRYGKGGRRGDPQLGGYMAFEFSRRGAQIAPSGDKGCPGSQIPTRAACSAAELRPSR
jgi:hypothetical protein